MTFFAICIVVLFARLVDLCDSISDKQRLFTLSCWLIIDTDLKCQGTMSRLPETIPRMYVHVDKQCL